MQPLFGGHRGARQIVIRGEIADPDWFAAAPNSARQANTASKATLLRVGLKLRHLEGWYVPHFNASQFVSSLIYAPYSAPIPAGAFAQNPDDYRSSVF